MENKEKNFISVVIYVHNAEDRIENFLKMIIHEMEQNFEYSEIICVNDCSVDNSFQKIKEASSTASTTSISIIHMSYFHGLELAMNAGCDMAIGDFVFEFDHTEFDFDKEIIMEIYRHALEGFDIVNASPDTKERFTSRVFYRIFERFTNLNYKMSTVSFRILSRRVINRINAMNKSIPYRKAVYVNSGLKIDTVKYPAHKNKKMAIDQDEKKYRLDLAIDSLMLFTEVGYRFSVAMTIFMMAMSAFMLAYSVITYAIAHPVAGWTTTIFFLSIAFFGLFGILTAIIKYLQLLIDLVFKRKHYSFENIEKLTR